MYERSNDGKELYYPYASVQAAELLDGDRRWHYYIRIMFLFGPLVDTHHAAFSRRTVACVGICFNQSTKEVRRAWKGMFKPAQNANESTMRPFFFLFLFSFQQSNIKRHLESQVKKQERVTIT
jgi:hypothetical protein